MMISCNAASKTTMLSMGSLELLLRASVFTVLDLNEMGGTTLPREVLGTFFLFLRLFCLVGSVQQAQQSTHLV